MTEDRGCDDVPKGKTSPPNSLCGHVVGREFVVYAAGPWSGSRWGRDRTKEVEEEVGDGRRRSVTVTERRGENGRWSEEVGDGGGEKGEVARIGEERGGEVARFGEDR